MHRRLGYRFGRLAMCGLIGFSSLLTACSDDDGDGGGDEAAASTDDPNAEWCASVRREQNAVTSERLDATIASAELAPDDLKADYEAIIEAMEFQAENPTDAVGIVEHNEAMREPAIRVLAAAVELCDIKIQL